ncbi:hypothetical protein M5K25_002018 [Dendrobium thyrsiflorum]|uniref:Uncharacterized protein n=1 Tax=Dendrobium thyrsiflorum TaxID=117978 RepID=A0ABD0W1S8_DENTH
MYLLQFAMMEEKAIDPYRPRFRSKSMVLTHAAADMESDSGDSAFVISCGSYVLYQMVIEGVFGVQPVHNLAFLVLRCIWYLFGATIFNDLSLLHKVALFPTVPSNHNSNVVGLDPFPHPPKLAIHAAQKAHSWENVLATTLSCLTCYNPTLEIFLTKHALYDYKNVLFIVILEVMLEFTIPSFAICIVHKSKSMAHCERIKFPEKTMAEVTHQKQNTADSFLIFSPRFLPFLHLLLPLDLSLLSSFTLFPNHIAACTLYTNELLWNFILIINTCTSRMLPNSTDITGHHSFSIIVLRTAQAINLPTFNSSFHPETTELSIPCQTPSP